MTVISRSCGCIATLLVTGFHSIAIAQDVDLVDVTLIDGTGAAARPHVSVSVRDGKVSAVTDRAPATSNGVRRIELKGRYLLPGLIDAHAHIESPAAALRALQSGVTTARVLGDTYLQASGTRDLVRAGHAPGPELLVSPGHIRPKPGLAFFIVYPSRSITRAPRRACDTRSCSGSRGRARRRDRCSKDCWNAPSTRLRTIARRSRNGSTRL